MRKLFQTASSCFPFPLSSKIHNPTHITVVFGWCSQKFANPEDKPCVPCPEVISGLHQRSNIWSSADCWVHNSFSYWKKRQWSWDSQRISLHSVLHLGTPCYRSVLLEPFSECFCYDSLFYQKTWVMRLTSKCLLWSWLIYSTGHLPALVIPFCTKVLLLQKDPSRDVMGLKFRKLREKLMMTGWSIALLYRLCLRGASRVLANTNAVAWGGLEDQ